MIGKTEKIFDADCFNAFCDWREGRISKEDAAKIIGQHGDEILFDMFMNGFKANLLIDPKNWIGVIGSAG